MFLKSPTDRKVCHAPHGGDYDAGRRSLLGNALLAGAGIAAGAVVPAGAQVLRGSRGAGTGGIIDCHHHIIPPESGLPDQWIKLTGWSPQNAVEQMDRAGVATGMAYSGPVLVDETEKRRATARLWNEYGARVGQEHPGRFGLFASLPLPDVEGSIREIDFALDELKADGFGIATSYGSLWLGDTALWPIWEKLDSRGAIVYVHPHNCASCSRRELSYQSLLPTAPGSEQSWIEWPMNTARTIVSLMLSGTLRRYPRIRFIFSHGGGLMPLLVERLAGFDDFVGVGKEKLRTVFPDGIQPEFAKLHFECAQAFSETNMTAVRSLVPDTQLVFGSDYFFFPVAHSARDFGRLKLPDGTRRAIARDNALRLFPRLQQPGDGRRI